MKRSQAIRKLIQTGMRLVVKVTACCFEPEKAQVRTRGQSAKPSCHDLTPVMDSPASLFVPNLSRSNANPVNIVIDDRNIGREHSHSAPKTLGFHVTFT